MLIAMDLDLTTVDLESMVEKFAPVVLGDYARQHFDRRKYWFGLGMERYDEVWHYLIDRHLLAEIRPLPQAVETLCRWAELGNQFAYLTARGMIRTTAYAHLFESVDLQTQYTLANYQFPYANQLHYVDRPRQKVEVMQTLCASVIVDDHARAVRTAHGQICHNGERIRAYLKHQGHNWAHRYVTRVRELAEVERHEPSLAG